MTYNIIATGYGDTIQFYIEAEILKKPMKKVEKRQRKCFMYILFISHIPTQMFK